MAGLIARWLTIFALGAIVTSCGLPLIPQAARPTPHPAGTWNPSIKLAQEAASPDPNFDYGVTIQITSEGFHPAILVSPCCQTVIWKNTTNAPVSISFDHQPVHSGQIPPGGSWQYDPPNMESIRYHLDGHPDVIGALQVNQMFESLGRQLEHEFTVS